MPTRNAKKDVAKKDATDVSKASAPAEIKKEETSKPSGAEKSETKDEILKAVTQEDPSEDEEAENEEEDEDEDEDEDDEEEEDEEEEDENEEEEEEVVVAQDGAEDYTQTLSERQKRKKLEVFVGGLDKDATEEDIKQVFKDVGDVIEIRLMKNSQTGKNKGFAFVRFGNQEATKRALTDLSHAKIRGKSFGVLQNEENDTLFIGNINKTWNKDAVLEKLNSYGIENIQELTLMADTQKESFNRGFAFVEFATYADSLKALKRLQKPGVVFGADKPAKVAWAQPLNEPDEETMAQVKTVFVDNIPSAWDEDKMKENFGKYGDIEKIVLSKNMNSAKRKDFGFITFATREAALSCVKAGNDFEVTDGNVNKKLKVNLAKPASKPKAPKSGIQGILGKGVGKNEKSLLQITSQGLSKQPHTSSQYQLLKLIREQAAANSKHNIKPSVGGKVAPGTGHIGGTGFHARSAVVPPDSRTDHDLVAHYRATIRQYGGAAPAVKRPYSALEEASAVRYPRARVDYPVQAGISGSQYPAVERHLQYSQPAPSPGSLALSHGSEYLARNSYGSTYPARNAEVSPKRYQYSDGTLQIRGRGPSLYGSSTGSFAAAPRGRYI